MNKALLCVVQSNWPQRISYVTTMYHDIFNSISLWRSQYLLQRNYINKKKTEPGSGKNQMPRMQNVRHLPTAIHSTFQDLPLSTWGWGDPDDGYHNGDQIVMMIKWRWWSNDVDLIIIIIIVIWSATMRMRRLSSSSSSSSSTRRLSYHDHDQSRSTLYDKSTNSWPISCNLS